MGWIKAPRDGQCCDCQPTPCAPCGSTPCDLSAPDDTVIGELAIDPSDIANESSFGDQPPGEYTLEYVNGAYQGGAASLPGTRWTVNPRTFIDGPSGTGVLWYAYKIIFGGDSSSPLPYDPVDYQASQAAAEAAFAPSGGPSTTFFHDGGEIKLIVHDAADFISGGSPNPTWRLTRIAKFAYDFPAQVRIKDYALFADGRWTLHYGSQVTALLAFDATAADVQAALNALAGIIADGGVTVSGSRAAGWTITWNNNGLRSALTGDVPTVTVGWRFVVTVTAAGDPSSVAVKKVELLFNCATCPPDEADLDEWDGTFPLELLDVFTTLQWDALPDDETPRLRLNEGTLYLARVRFVYGGLEGNATGCGWVLWILCLVDSEFHFAEVWKGVKLGGTSPVGVYARSPGATVGDGAMCNSTNGPATLEIEAILPP